MRALTLSVIVLLVMVTVPGTGAAQKAGTSVPSVPVTPGITFVELGSVKCVPCRMMQPVMKNIETRYGSQIRIIFYDVWKPEQKKFATEYGVRIIPTQVFLDRNGKEVFRHEGFFAESAIDTLLQKHGLKPNS